MSRTTETLEHIQRIGTPTRLGMHLAEQIWGAGVVYRVDPWLALVEQEILPMVRDTDEYSFAMVNCPPQIGKTSYSGELLPFWLLGLFPDLRIIFITYSDDYSKTKGATVRNLIDRYGMEMFGVQLDPKNQSAGDWSIAGHRGGMLSVGIGSQITGRSGDIIIIDDVIKNAEEAASVAAKRRHVQEYDGTIRTRLQPGGTILITATRWADDDLSGTLQARQNMPEYDGDVYEVYSFPAIAEPDDDHEDDEDWHDELGRVEGEPLLCRFTKEGQPWDRHHFNRVRRSIDPFTYSCLYQQRPSAREGGMFPKANWAWFDPDEPPYMAEVMRVWDLAATAGGGDFTVGSKVAKDFDGEWYVLDVIRVRRDADAVFQLVRSTAQADGFLCKVRLEESRDGAGKSVASYYKLDPVLRQYNIDSVRAEGQKESRATPYSVLQNGGHFHLPQGVDWVKDFVDEHKQMMGDGRRPKHDDQIDTVAYAVLEMASSGPVTMLDPSDYLSESTRAMTLLAQRLGIAVA